MCIRDRTGIDPTIPDFDDPVVSALHTLDVWNHHLAEVGAQLLYARLRLLRDLAPFLRTAYREVSAGVSDAAVSYRASVREEAAAAVSYTHLDVYKRQV